MMDLPAGFERRCRQFLDDFPEALNTFDTLVTGKFLASVARNGSSACPSASINGDVRLLTLGFLASTTGNVRVKFISNTDPMVTGNGHCGILAYAAGGSIGALPIPCDDGSALLTAHR